MAFHDSLDMKRDTRAGLQRIWIRLNQWHSTTGLRFPADEKKALLRAIKGLDAEIALAEESRARYKGDR